jgi:hypothetical protein
MELAATIAKIPFRRAHLGAIPLKSEFISRIRGNRVAHVTVLMVRTFCVHAVLYLPRLRTVKCVMKLGGTTEDHAFRPVAHEEQTVTEGFFVVWSNERRDEGWRRKAQHCVRNKN